MEDDGIAESARPITARHLVAHGASANGRTERKKSGDYENRTKHFFLGATVS